MKIKLNSFSLAEALIVILIIGICACLSVPYFKKKIDKHEYQVHGSYECYMSNGKYIETYRTKKGKILTKEEKNSCEFKPPHGSSEFHVDICAQNAELMNCNYNDGSHTFMYYPRLGKVKDIKRDSEFVYFGSHLFAVNRGGDSRVLVLY